MKEQTRVAYFAHYLAAREKGDQRLAADMEKSAKQLDAELADELAGTRQPAAA